jgi:thiol-disulfide isomerase/thioredoxin
MRNGTHSTLFRDRILLTFLVALAVALVAALPGRTQTDAGKAPPHAGKAVGATYPPLIDLAGYRQLLAKYKGKPLVVNFWATWCEPCREEYPMIVELAKEFKPQGISVIGVDMDDESDMNLVRRFIARVQPPFPNYRQKPGIDLDFLRARRADRGIFPGHSAAARLRTSIPRNARPRAQRRERKRPRRNPVSWNIFGISYQQEAGTDASHTRQ